MVQFTSNHYYCSFFLLVLFLFSISTAVVSFPLHISLPDGVKIVGEINESLPWKAWGSMMKSENPHGANINSTILVLAQKRTNRTDFFNHFTRYTRGWNITDDNYISSVISTAVPFFGVAIVWFVIFGLSLLLICLCYCCCHVEPYGYSRCAYALSLIFLILFTIATIIGCVILYTSQVKLHRSTLETLDYVVSQAKFTSENLNNVSDFFDTAKQVGLAEDLLFLPPSYGKDIDHVKTIIRNAVATLSHKTEENSKEIHMGIEGMRLALIIIAVVMLFIALAGFLLSILGLQCLVYGFVLVGWILIAVTFILCGAFIFLHNVIGDTCVAMDEWVLHPTAHTALDEILPCVESTTALETLLRSKDVTHVLVSTVDRFISNVTNGHNPHLNYNQSGPFMPILCNPFQHNLTARNCEAGEVTLENANEVWMNYVCEVSSSEKCVSSGRMTPNIYTQITGVVNATYGLYHYGPFLGDLVDCSFVRKTFSDISHNYCPSLRISTKWISFGLVLVSVAVMLSLIFWIIHQKEQRHRLYTKRMHHLESVR